MVLVVEGIFVIFLGIALIKYRGKFKELAVRQEQAAVDTFSKTPVLPQYFSARKQLAQKFGGVLSAVAGIFFIIMGVITIIVAILQLTHRP